MIGSQVAALYVRADSIYKQLIGVECFDIARDARSYRGPWPVVAHPPCRAWGRLSHFAKPREDEKALGFHAVEMVRQWGGVLEHPASSKLFAAAGMPRPGDGVDRFGGWSWPIKQQCFGHSAPKYTWLYIVGCEPSDLPAYGLRLGVAPGRIENMGKAAREHTPEPLARWLVCLAGKCGRAK